MGGAGDLGKAKCMESGVVFGQFDPGLKFKRGKPQRTGTGFREVDEGGGEALAAMRCGNGKLSKVERAGFRRDKDAGHGGMPDGSYLTRPGLQGDRFRGKAVHRGRRVDPAFHEGELGPDEREEGRPVTRFRGAMGRHLGRRPSARVIQRSLSSLSAIRTDFCPAFGAHRAQSACSGGLFATSWG
jgi:hypothetical protein